MNCPYRTYVFLTVQKQGTARRAPTEGGMTNNPEVHHRQSIRLCDYDYSRAGAYFVTVCAWQRECLFGEVVDGEMRLNDAGQVVTDIWDALPQRYQEAKVDVFMAMPNHIHGIIVINDPGFGGRGVGAIHELPLHTSPLRDRRNMALPKIIGYLKMNSAKSINQQRNTPGVPVWQRNYYERVIRDESEFHAIRQYIIDNPLKWVEDENHPTQLLP